MKVFTTFNTFITVAYIIVCIFIAFIELYTIKRSNYNKIFSKKKIA